MLMFRHQEEFIQALKSGEQFQIDDARFVNHYMLDCHYSDEYYMKVNGIHGWPIAVVRPETMTIDQPFFLLEVNFNGCAMNNIANCKSLMEAFEPGVGRNAVMDNSAGAMLKTIKSAIYEITMATHLDDVGVITDETMEGLCAAADLLVGVFAELKC